MTIWVMLYLATAVVSMGVLAGVANDEPKSSGWVVPAGLLWPIFILFAIGFGIGGLIRKPTK